MYLPKMIGIDGKIHFLFFEPDLVQEKGVAKNIKDFV